LVLAFIAPSFLKGYLNLKPSLIFPLESVHFPLKRYNYPGDKYVDWIGFSGYDRAAHRRYYGNRNIDAIFDHAIKHFSDYNKPFMISEFGTANEKEQSKWLIKAGELLRQRPMIKAAVFFDGFCAETQTDERLNQEGRVALKEVIKSDYFIGAK
jgi:hypothetical protein